VLQLLLHDEEALKSKLFALDFTQTAFSHCLSWLQHVGQGILDDAQLAVTVEVVSHHLAAAGDM